MAEILSVPCHAVLNHRYHSRAIDRFKSKSGRVYVSTTERRKKQQLMRLPSQQPTETAPQELNPQTAVYILVEYIKNHQASLDGLSKAVARRQVIATPQAIARFIDKHDLKKTLP